VASRTSEFLPGEAAIQEKTPRYYGRAANEFVKTLSVSDHINDIDNFCAKKLPVQKIPHSPSSTKTVPLICF
jgi:hypothetical protein